MTSCWLQAVDEGHGKYLFKQHVSLIEHVWHQLLYETMYTACDCCILHPCAAIESYVLLLLMQTHHTSLTAPSSCHESATST